MIFVNGTCTDPRGVELATNLALRSEIGAAGVIPTPARPGFVGGFVNNVRYRVRAIRDIEEAMELGATALAIGGHQLCHRNKVTDREQIRQIVDAIEICTSRFPEIERYIGTFCVYDETAGSIPWQVRYVFDSEAKLPIYEA